ncbi:hypothetical protein SAMN04488105_108231 [Salipiger thiooxidans]|uniref:PPC domain-containing protein n=1 Tax=Salipiger thiooxidans TaxID=282683 RepID=A0A1G7G9R3_9RHOB|nr:DUF296 domain-containing protein [Salipiger thiooxidans]SDE84876.1 hypothetical protein SAMN04488105_108231 [Salipiger thiooxidans]
MNSTVDTPLYSTGRHVALRLKPGEEVLGTLQQFVVDHGIAACAIVSSVGSLTHAAIRYANQNDTTRLEGHFEICSLIGTLECAAPGEALNGAEASASGGAHVHLSISDGAGRMIGGHMMRGCRVYTTLEIVLLVLDGLSFTREPCDASGYAELVIRNAAEDTGKSNG